MWPSSWRSAAAPAPAPAPVPVPVPVPAPATPAPTPPASRPSGPTLDDKSNKAFNVIIFGETGSGKSSVINMICERSVAETSSGAAGCTFLSRRYVVDIKGTLFSLYDTAGLNEGEEGRVTSQEAIAQLFHLMRSLSNGISLLIFCMRAPRIRENAHKNWRLFHEIICQMKVPIVITITGLENEDPMERWWWRNKREFQQYEMFPVGVACITATRGKRRRTGEYTLDDEYEASKKRVWRLIIAHYLEVPWKLERIQWFAYVVKVSYATKWCIFPQEVRELCREPGQMLRKLAERCEMSEAEAKALVKRLESNGRC